MKYAVALFALFTVAMGQFIKVPRQAGVQVQTGAMTDAQGNVIPFDSTNVYKAAEAAGA